MRKARQAVGAVLEEKAPQQSAHLWKTLVSFKSLEAQDSSSDTEDGDVDQVLMVALAECYMNVSTWQARHEILSIVADKLQFRTVRRWILDLTRYHFTTAREHAIHRCEELTAVLHEIDEGIQRMSSINVSEDTREELFFVSDQSKQNILAWKAHLTKKYQPR